MPPGPGFYWRCPGRIVDPARPRPLPYLYLDIGTNSEVILADKKDVGASAAAGPKELAYVAG